MSEPTIIAAPAEHGSPSQPVPAAIPPVIPKAGVSSAWRWGGAALAVALLAALVLLFAFNPSQHAFYPLCVFHRLTGLQCPGCGGLRAVHHLLHGEVITAFRFNQLFVLALPLAGWFTFRRLWRGSRPKPISPRVQARWAWGTLAVLIAFWILRTLPLEIFKLPTG